MYGSTVDVPLASLTNGREVSLTASGNSWRTSPSATGVTRALAPTKGIAAVGWYDHVVDSLSFGALVGDEVRLIDRKTRCIES